MSLPRKSLETMNKRTIAGAVSTKTTRPGLATMSVGQRRAKAKTKRRAIVARLEEAHKDLEFRAGIYNQYTVDLLTMTQYVRKIITTPALHDYLKAHHARTLQELMPRTAGRPTVVVSARGAVLVPIER